MSKHAPRSRSSSVVSSDSDLQLIELPVSQLKIEQLSEQAELFQSDLDQLNDHVSELKQDLKSHRAEIETSLLYVVKLLTDKGFLNRVGELQGRITKIEVENRLLNEKLERYTNLPVLKQLRAFRRWWFGL